MRKKRRIITILLLVVLMLGLGAGYYILNKSNAEKEAAEEAEGDKSVDLFEWNKDDIAKIRYQNDAADLTLVKNDGLWVKEGQDKVPMNQENVGEMLGALEKVTASFSLQPESGDLAEYGLKDDLFLEIWVTMKDDKEYNIKFGMEVPTDSGRYALVEGDSSVYVLPFSLFNKFKYSEAEMVAVEDEFEVDVNNISHFLLEREGKEPFEIRRLDDKNDWKSSYYAWRIVKPYEKEVMADTTNMREFFEGFSKLSFDQCVEYQASDLSKYGLDKPKATMTMDYSVVVEVNDNGNEDTQLNTEEPGEEEKQEVREDKSYTLKIGGQDEEGNYYVQVDGKNHVYTLPSTTVEPIVGMDLFHVSDQCVFLGKITDMSGYEFTVNGQTHTVERKEVKKEKEDSSEEGSDASSSEDDEENENTYYVDGKLVDANEFVNIFSATFLLEFSGLADDSVKPESNEPALSLNYHMMTGEDVKIDFVPYDGSNFYRVINNGVDYFLTDKRGVDDIARRYQEFVEGME